MEKDRWLLLPVISGLSWALPGLQHERQGSPRGSNVPATVHFRVTDGDTQHIAYRHQRPSEFSQQPDSRHLGWPEGFLT